ncbi:MAG: hypothetical protein JSS99_08620 [Actinobacteria bacterium]|nr:hypothetical protein [Actinomycetota bacterium]
MPYAHGIEENDVVRFTRPVGEWPAGMGGTVVNTWRDEVMVEIVEHPSGYTLDVIDVPVDSVVVTIPQGIPAVA